MTKPGTQRTVVAVLIIMMLFWSISTGEAHASAMQLTRTLKMGMSGEDVAVVQQHLQEQGFYTYPSITGYFGRITDSAVKAFQKAHGLSIDGIIGPATRKVMNDILKNNDSSQEESGKKIHVVKSGDTMWKISQQYDVLLDKLLAANGMSPDSIIYVGQNIIIPDGSGGTSGTELVHIVKSGDTMWKISHQYNVPLDELLSCNGMSPDTIIYVGQKIMIPQGEQGNSQPSLKYVNHKVKSGDNLWSLSYEYGIPVQEIADANGITASTILYIGQVLKIPQHIIPVKPTPGPQYGELLDWWSEAQYVFPLNAVATVTDFYTGISFNVQRTYGYGHADVEPLTAEDTKTMRGIWEKHHVLWNGSVDYWARRPVIVHVNGRKLAASASAMTHAGVDSAPEGSYVQWRSGDFGPGTNFDRIKGNGADGHFDIHFLNSTRHSDGSVDQKHQAMVKIAAGK